MREREKGGYIMEVFEATKTCYQVALTHKNNFYYQYRLHSITHNTHIHIHTSSKEKSEK